MKKRPASPLNEDELLVAGILLDLAESEPLNKCPSTWGTKRKRSAIANSPLSLFATETHTRRKPTSSKLKVEATSPSTPLAFFPSESESKSKNSPNKKTREEWLEIIEGLTQRKELLTREVENVRNYYSQLQDFNLLLKAKKQELSVSLKKEDEITPVKIHLEKQDQIIDFAPQQLFYMDPSGRFAYPFGQMMQPIPPTTGLARANQIEPPGIFDLNVSAGEISQQFVYPKVSRANAAEARKQRKLKMKGTKKSIPSTVKPQRVNDNRVNAAEARKIRKLKLQEIRKSKSSTVNSQRCRSNQTKPRGIVDLKQPAEELPQQFVNQIDNKAITAEARKMRLLRIKEIKKSSSSVKSERGR